VRCDDRIAPLIRVVKCWAQQHGAQSADPSDGLNSFALTLLIFHWMQRCEPRPMLPPLRPLFAALAEEPELPLDAAMGELGVAPSHCKGSVAELLHRFVRYYATVCPATRGGGSAVPYVLRLLDVDRDGEDADGRGAQRAASEPKVLARPPMAANGILVRAEQRASTAASTRTSSFAKRTSASSSGR
jgi:hypothetical protein